MGRVRERWKGLSRAYQHAIVLAIADILFLIGALLHIRVLAMLWSALTSYLPNIYEPIFLQIVALVRDASPGTMVASGLFISYSSAFLMLLTVHVLVGFGLGFLFDHTPRTLVWSFTSFFTLILVLFALHLSLIIFPGITA